MLRCKENQIIAFKDTFFQGHKNCVLGFYRKLTNVLHDYQLTSRGNFPINLLVDALRINQKGVFKII